jgi:hypothetical protein
MANDSVRRLPLTGRTVVAECLVQRVWVTRQAKYEAAAAGAGKQSVRAPKNSMQARPTAGLPSWEPCWQL